MLKKDVKNFIEKVIPTLLPFLPGPAEALAGTAYADWLLNSSTFYDIGLTGLIRLIPDGYVLAGKYSS